jgi:hypothetical protein
MTTAVPAIDSGSIRAIIDSKELGCSLTVLPCTASKPKNCLTDSTKLTLEASPAAETVSRMVATVRLRTIVRSDLREDEWVGVDIVIISPNFRKTMTPEVLQ